MDGQYKMNSLLLLLITHALLSSAYSKRHKSARQREDEQPICVPIGTCISKEINEGGVNIRIVTPEDECPKGQELCNQYTPALRCGYTFSNASHVNGETPEGRHPWLAYITNQTGYTGSGALLDSFHVLTAAHKVYKNMNSLQKLTVYIGVQGRNSLPAAYKRVVEDMIIHPKFDPVFLKNDLALLRFKAIPLGYMKNVGTACLPKSGASFTNKRCIVAGWGRTKFFHSDAPTNNLKHVKVPIVSYHACYQSMKKILGAEVDKYMDKDGEICAGGERGIDACTDDGGAPLVCSNDGRKVIAGLVIWGKGCGQENVYGVYANVPHYVDWIQRARTN